MGRMVFHHPDFWGDSMWLAPFFFIIDLFVLITEGEPRR